MATEQAATDPLFDLSGGELCLDLANTAGDRPCCASDSLTGYGRLLVWGRQSGLLGPSRAARLRRIAAAKPAIAREVLDRALDLRERIYRIFSAVAADRSPAPKDLTRLNLDLTEALPHRQIARSAGGFAWRWCGPADALDSVLWPVVHSAARLLTSEERVLVRECASDTCSWLFVDRSRSHRRRWCDMKVCGNRNKARRYYSRKQSGCSE